MIKTSACILYIDGDKVLGVSRGSNLYDWGLPGGKVEAGETPKEGAIREFQEETGLTIEGFVELVFVRKSRSTICFTYIIEGAKGDIVSTKEGEVRWITIFDLCNGSFKDYNKKLFEAIGVL